MCAERFSTDTPDRSPALVLLHFFGSSKREWRELQQLLSPVQPVFVFDMPGFGDNADAGPVDVAGMTDTLHQWIRSAVNRPCVIVGHSMSGKVAAVLASRRPDYLRGLVLVTPSPPSPEPMPSRTREKLLAFDGSRSAAEDYVDSVSSQRLPDSVREPAIEDAQRASLAAWKAWIEEGSQEDWTARVGLVLIPTLIVAASDDPALGTPVQAQKTFPHFVHGRLATISGGHALPLENPSDLREQIEGFMDSLLSQ